MNKVNKALSNLFLRTMILEKKVVEAIQPIQIFNCRFQIFYDLYPTVNKILRFIQKSTYAAVC